jgi:hypothetical protein
MQSSPALRTAVPGSKQAADDPAFSAAVAELHAGLDLARAARPELILDEEPPPRRLAPRAVAFAATVESGATEIGWGRFVLLYDPAGQDGWVGPFRVIAYVRADLEPDIAADPLLGQVGWTWLTEALEARSAGYEAPSGTVTRVVTEGFGAKHSEQVATGFEMRASWSPVAPPAHAVSEAGLHLDRHVVAWCDALCTASGLPPIMPGVTHLRPRPARPGPGP